MKKYILTFLVVSLFTACDKEQKNTQSVDLQQQKEQIEKQIDSLNKVLSGINEQLGKNKEKEIPAIDVQVVQPENFTHYIDAQGNIDTDGNVMVIPEAMGKVIKIYKNEGDYVRKGQTILRLDDSMIRSQIAEINTQYSLAKTAFERQKRLWDQKIGSEMAFLQAKTKKEALVRKRNTLYTQLKKTIVKSPISGTLDDLMIKEGEMAGPQRPVARVVNLKKVYLQADLSEKYLTKIKRGTPVRINFPEMNKQIDANISYVGSFIHPNNRTFKIRINLLNLDQSLKPNLTGNIKIKDFEHNQAMVLALALIQEDRQGNNFVYVLKPTEKDSIYQVQKQPVKTGLSYKGKVLIEEGLQQGDILALQGARGLTEGDLVKVKNPAVLENETQKDVDNQQDKQVDNKTHIVQKGETLYQIHKKYKVSLANLRTWNHLKNDALQVGQKLIIAK